MNKNNEKKSLLNRWRNRKKGDVVSKSIEKVKSNIDHPLSHAQKRLWFLQQMHPESPLYNISDYYLFKGDLSIRHLKESINFIFNEHRIFKSVYVLKDNKVSCEINTELQLNIEEYNFTNLDSKSASRKVEEYTRNQAHINFDLQTGPLVKGTILKVNQEETVLFITLHHIIADQWSISVLRQEIAKNYRELIQGIEIITNTSSKDFLDYAHWEEQKSIDAHKLSFWKQKLNGNLPVLNLPADFSRPLQPSFEGHLDNRKFSKEMSSKLLALASTLEVTPFALFLAAYYILLYKLTDQNDILIGTPVSTRNVKSVEKALGLFIDTIVLRHNLNPEQSLTNIVKQVQELSIESIENKDVPFDALVKELNVKRSLSVNPFFQVMFVYNALEKVADFGEEVILEDNHIYSASVSKFDLTLFITEENVLLSSTFEYSTDLFQESTISQFQNHLEQILRSLVDNDENLLSDISLFSHKEFKPKLSENQVDKKATSFHSFKSIHEVIENMAITKPHDLAVSYLKDSITYKELSQSSSILATTILKKTRPKKIIALCLERSIEMIIGLQAILKSGCAYLPIDPTYPEERIHFILKDAEVDCIVTQKSLEKRFIKNSNSTILVDDINDNQETNFPIFPGTSLSDLAYVIYTSGSTGKPKGVPITHGNIINSTNARLDFYDKAPSAFLLLSSISFDSSKAGIFWTLCTGGNLIIGENRLEQDIEKIRNIINDYKVSHTLMLPSLYQVLLSNINPRKLESLDTVIVAGESCSKSLCKAHFTVLPEVYLYNEYGPTEATVWCLAHRISQKDINRSSIPIGLPIKNTDVYLLDSNKKRVPHGASGEIYIGGANLSQGYLNNSELSSAAFIDNPFINNEKLYKTGDLGRYNNDGTIEFLGRADDQIKIRGYRIEIQEIENIINNVLLINNTIVLVKDNGRNTKQLVAFLIIEEEFDEHKLKIQLSKFLPDYMIPASFIVLNEMPLLPNGKINKLALEKIAQRSESKDSGNYKKPTTKIETKLITIWEDILQMDSIGTNDNFFEIGGDSILSIQIIAKARKLGLKIAPNQIFEHQTIAELALFLEDISKKEDEIGIVTGDIPLTPIQHWFFDTHRVAPEFWNQAFKIKGFQKAIDVSLLRKITKRVIETHDALRSNFVNTNDGWNAKILAPHVVEAFSVIDVSSSSPLNIERLISSELSDIQKNIELEKGGLFKCLVFDTADYKTSQIVLLAHHLVIDFVSWQIILNYYTNSIEANEPEQIIKTHSLTNWSKYLTDLSSNEKTLSELLYWKEQLSSINELPLDYDCSLPISEEEVDVLSFKLEKDHTKSLLGEANRPYGTNINELITTAFVITLLDWTNTEHISLALESHGRDVHNHELDLTNTVGWFTSFFPQAFNLDSSLNLASKIIKVKEQLRNIKNSGIDYGILKYLTDELPEVNTFPNIVFNYLGKQNTDASNIEFVSKGMRHPKSERYYYLEVNALIVNNVLEFQVSYTTLGFSQDTIEALIFNFKEKLLEIKSHCMTSKNIKYTPSDFKDADIDQEDLDNLLENIDF